MVRVLVVDDNTSFREVFSRGLDHQPDIEVVSQAGSLAEARSSLEGIDVAIIDRSLPDGDGLDLIGYLREANPDAKVLVMSLTVEDRHPMEALEAGADGILDKVDTPARIADRVRDVVAE
jgi:two-component system NarL family response regulator/two-component system response regulator DevR